MYSVLKKFMLDFLDVSSVARHSNYFNQTRSHFIYRRTRLIALLLAVAQTLWVLVDYMLLPREVQGAIGIARVSSSLMLLGLVLWFGSPYSLSKSMLRFGLMVITLSAFQTFSNIWLFTHDATDIVAGYQFFPFMIITMIAIFPLTVVEVCVLVGLMLIVELITQTVLGKLFTMSGVDSLWLMLVLGLIAGWASVNQLGMLLGLYRQATRDPLTGLANRRELMEHLDHEVGECAHNDKPLTVLLFDLDKFKHFNDSYGHAAGDIVLKQFSSILRNQSQGENELAGRFGGEEFVLLLPGVDKQGAIPYAEQILAACHLSPVRIPSGERVGFTTSIGIAQLQPGQSSSELITQSDMALYRAKFDGRDCYRIYDPSMRLQEVTG